MAYENYVRDLSYLISGDLSDLTLNFSDKSWRIHKALVVCHSKWFQKALTGGLVETSSEAITLQDDPVYTNAIDCMVSYIYEAGYNVSKFDTIEPLLHAQVTIIADKYDCASLCKLAKTSFADTVMTVNPSDWAVTAAFVYDHTTTVPPAHMELRNSVIAAVAGRHWMLKATLREERVLDVLRSNADLATDLLLGGRYGPKVEGVSEHHFICDHCHYSHTGSRDCPNITSVSKTGKPVCPKCRKKTGNPIHHTPMVNIYPAFSCASCDGFHTTDPDDEDLT